LTAASLTQTAQEQRAQLSYLELAAKLDVKAATSLKTELAVILDETGPVVLKASSVTRMSTAACQLLVAFIIALRALNRSIRIIEPSPQFSSAFALLGLSNFIIEER
jgi:anti-anti-sigma regulatory factor